MKSNLCLLALVLIVSAVVLTAASAAENEVIKEELDSIKADIPERISILSEQMQLTQVEFTSLKDINSTQMRIAEIRGRPSSAPALKYNVYEYFEIEVPKLEDSDLKSVYLTFYVPVKWMENLDINKSAVKLFRFAGGEKWEELGTELIKETLSLCTYKANSPGFQYFAIAGERDTKETETEASAGQITSAAVKEPEPQTVEELNEENEEESDVKTITSSTTLEQKESSNFSIYLLLGVIIVLLIVICYLIFGLKVRHSKASNAIAKIKKNKIIIQKKPEKIERKRAIKRRTKASQSRAPRAFARAKARRRR